MPRPQPGFEIWEHTADAGVTAHGRTLGEAFAQAAAGMYALMVDPDTVYESVLREVAIHAPDVERLLVNWLVELLVFTDAEGVVFRRFVVEVQDTTLHGRAYGERINPQRHTVRGQVKAVTRHQLEVAREEGSYRVRVLFDM
jgi:SHS2 domain-containing protein